jgi:hypothetical protein
MAVVSSDAAESFKMYPDAFRRSASAAMRGSRFWVR